MSRATKNSKLLSVRPLTRDSFAPYGQVIEAGAGNNFLVNDGTAMRFHDLAWVDVSLDHGRPCISIFRAQPRKLPMQLTKLERHPLSSQAFVPMCQTRFLVVVATGGDSPENPVAFVSTSGQGINYDRGIWHHPLIALETETDFLVIDRNGPGENCNELELIDKLTIPKIDEAQ